MQKTDDTKIRQSLDEIAKILEKISEASLTQQAPTLIKSLQAQGAQLQSTLKQYQAKHFSYEFYQAASEIVIHIDEMRRTPNLYSKLRQLHILEHLDNIVAKLREAVFRHEALAEFIKTKPISVHTLEEAQEFMHTAMEVSSQLTAAVDQANAVGVKNLEEIQAEQEKSGGVINSKLLQRSIQHTIAMSAINAAAVIASDEATAALLQFEEYLKNSSDLRKP